jgi:hypothetical protein
MEWGMLTDELPTLRDNDYYETNEENETGLCHVLLLSISMYLQQANWYPIQLSRIFHRYRLACGFMAAPLQTQPAKRG